MNFPGAFKKPLIDLLDGHLQYVERHFEKNKDKQEVCKTHLKGNTQVFFNITCIHERDNYLVEKHDINEKATEGALVKQTPKEVIDKLAIWLDLIVAEKGNSKNPEFDKLIEEIDKLIKNNPHVDPSKRKGDQLELVNVKTPGLNFFITQVGDKFKIKYIDIVNRISKPDHLFKIEGVIFHLTQWLETFTRVEKSQDKSPEEKIKSPTKPIKPTILATEFNKELVMYTREYLLKVDNALTDIRKIWGEIDSEKRLMYLTHLFDDGILHHKTESTLEVMLTAKGLSLKREHLDENGRFVAKSQDNSPKEKIPFPSPFREKLTGFIHDNSDLLSSIHQPGDMKILVSHDPGLIFNIRMTDPSGVYDIQKIESDKKGPRKSFNKTQLDDKEVFNQLNQWKDNIIVQELTPSQIQLLDNLFKDLEKLTVNNSELFITKHPDEIEIRRHNAQDAFIAHIVGEQFRITSYNAVNGLQQYSHTFNQSAVIVRFSNWLGSLNEEEQANAILHAKKTIPQLKTWFENLSANSNNFLRHLRSPVYLGLVITGVIAAIGGAYMLGRDHAPYEQLEKFNEQKAVIKKLENKQDSIAIQYRILEQKYLELKVLNDSSSNKPIN